MIGLTRTWMVQTVITIHSGIATEGQAMYTAIYARCTPTGLDIKQFGPLAQGASRFEKLLARGPVDLRSYWPEGQ